MKRTISAEGRQRRTFWENHLREWQASGLSQAGYCRKHGLSKKSSVYWKKRLANRYGIEIERGFDEETLDRLLRLLEKR